MIEQKEISELIGEIYETTLNQKNWDHVLNRICELSGARSAGIYIRERQSNVTWTFSQVGMPGLTKTMYSNGLGRLDPGFDMLGSTKPGDNIQIVNLHQPESTPSVYHQLVLRPMGIHHVSGICIFNDEQLLGGIGLHRGKGENPFDKDILDDLGQLAPHIHRAIRIYLKFERLRAQKSDLQAGFERLALGVIFLDESLSPTYTNPVAEQLLKQNPAISLGKDKRIRSYDHKQTQMLRKQVLACLEGVPSYNYLGLRHPDIKHPLVAMVVPAGENSSGDDNSAILYLNDPAGDKNFLPEDALIKNYDLSRAEARVALALMDGLSAEQIASQLNRSVNTVKTQTRRIYEKTGVSRQAELVNLLLASTIPLN